MSDVATDKPTKSTEIAEIDLTESPARKVGGLNYDNDTESGSITESVENEEVDYDAAVDFYCDELSTLEEMSASLDCPFYWQSDLNIRAYGDHEIDPLSEFEEISEEPSFCLRSFHRFSTHLILCFHNFYKRLVEDSMKNIDEMENIIHHSTVEVDDVIFFENRDVLLRMMYSCRYFILHSMNRVEEAKKILEKVEQCMPMNKAKQAMSLAMRAAVYVEYGYEPLRTAIDYMDRAIKLNSDNAFWHFLKGLYLGRLRRMRNVSIAPLETEVRNLEMAIKKRGNAMFYSFTAETYIEMIESIEKEVDKTKSPDSSMEELSSTLDKLTEIATRYLIKSVEGKGDSAHLLFRCGQGLMRLRHPHRDLVRAEALLRRGLELSPESSYGNYAMAVYIMSYKEDFEAAKLCLEKSAARRNFRAHLDLCRERFLKDEISVSLELEKLLDIYKETPKMCKIYGELICYRLLLRYNLVKACSYAQSLIALQTSWIKYIYDFNSSIFPLSRSVPLLILLISEIQNELSCESSSDVKKNACKTLLHFILEEGIQTPQKIPEDILSRYFEDMNEGMLQHRQFPLVKSEAKKKHDGTNDECSDRKPRNSSHKEYHKYYAASKNKTVCDILPPQTESRIKEVQQKHRHQLPRRYSGSSSESSASDREIPKHLVKGLESLAISEAGTSRGKERSSPERSSSRDKRRRSPKVDLRSSRSNRRTVEESGDDCTSNSSSDRKSVRSNRSRKNLVDSPDKDSVSSFRDGEDNSRCARSSPERKSSSSHREHRNFHRRNRDDSGSNSCSSDQSHRDDESKCRSKRHADSQKKSSRSDREHRQRRYRRHDDGSCSSSSSSESRSSGESTRESERRKDSEKSSESEGENRHRQRKSRDDRSCSSSKSRKRRNSSSESTRRSKRYEDSYKKSSRSDRKYRYRRHRSRSDGSRSRSRSREKRCSESTRRGKRHRDSDERYSRSDREHRHRLRRRRDDSYSSRSGERYSGGESTRESERRKNRDQKLSRSDRCRQRRSRDDSYSYCSSSRSRDSSGESTRRRECRRGHRRERNRRERSYSSDESRRHRRDKNYHKLNKSKRSYTRES